MELIKTVEPTNVFTAPIYSLIPQVLFNIFKMWNSDGKLKKIKSSVKKYTLTIKSSLDHLQTFAQTFPVIQPSLSHWRGVFFYMTGESAKAKSLWVKGKNVLLLAAFFSFFLSVGLELATQTGMIYDAAMLHFRLYEYYKGRKNDKKTDVYKREADTLFSDLGVSSHRLLL